MKTLIAFIPALTCGAMMLFICIPMMFRKHDGTSEESASKQEVAELREEVARLKAQHALGEKSEFVDG